MQQGTLDNFGTAVLVFCGRQRFQQGRVTEDQGGLVKRAHLIFAAGKIYGGLAAHGGIHRREQGGGHLDIGQAPVVGGGGKARQVAYHAAAQGDDTIAAGKVIVKQGLHQGGIGGKGFGFFSVGKNKAGDPEACAG